jgi:hypothetical protein
MGSILSKIQDDEEEYEFLCKKYNETPDEVYGAHHDWLSGRNNGTVTITFEEYKRNGDIRMLKMQLVRKQEELLRLEKERDEIFKKLIKLGVQL